MGIFVLYTVPFCLHVCQIRSSDCNTQKAELEQSPITSYNTDGQIQTRPFSIPGLNALNTQVALPPFTGRRNIISCPPLWLLTEQDVVNIGRVNTGKLALARKDNSAGDNVICVGSPARLDGQVLKVSSGREAHHMRRETIAWR